MWGLLRPQNFWRRLTIAAALAGIVVPVAAPPIVDVLTPGPEPETHLGKSGIYGTVSFGGPCGFPSEACASPLSIAAAQQVRRFSEEGRIGRIVTEFRSSKDGEFELEVPRGRYVILQSLAQMRRGKGMGFLHPAEVVVPKGKWVEVNLWYDNGMRSAQTS
jgi:hypothetical protein